ncbi:MAG: histidine kinase, partial [Pseudomonadota bacterium]
MSETHPVLGQLALGYCPMVGRDGTVVATRLSVFPAAPDAVPDPKALLDALQPVWPADQAPSAAAAAAPPRPLERPSGTREGTVGRAPVVLNIAGEAALEAMMRAAPGPQVMLEIPAFMATDPARQDTLRARRDAGTPLLIKGRPLQTLTPE